MNVSICDYGGGNIYSLRHAFERLGARVRTDGAAEADLTVLPGVGSAAAAMRGLQERGLDGVLCDRVRDGRPVLGVCLGLQLALESTDEDGGVRGLGLVPGRAVRLRAGRVPRIGWAKVDRYGSAFYFAHSYAADTTAATAFSEGLVAEARAGSFLGVQFHPEKSGAAGARYLASCLSRA